MPEAPSPDRSSLGSRIQEKQEEIDKLDKKLDSKVDIEGLSDDQKDVMKKTYIDKVNLFQGKVGRAFKKIDVQRDLRSPGWRDWEKAVLKTEVDLYKLLRSAHEKLRNKEEVNNVDNGLVTFNLKVDEFLNTLSRLSKTHESSPPTEASESAEKNAVSPKSINAIFADWGVPGSKEEVSAKAKQALEHYPENQIHELVASLSLYESLPNNLKEKLFGTKEPVGFQKIAGQLANGKFDKKNKSAPLAFLLTEGLDNIEGRVLQEAEEVRDRADMLSQRVSNLKNTTREYIVDLCKTVKEDVPTGKIGSIVTWVANLDGYPEVQANIVEFLQILSKETQENQKEINALRSQLVGIDYAFNALDKAKATNRGDQKAEAQLIFREKVDFSQDVSLSDEQLALLSPAQQQLFLENHDEALKVAIDSFNNFQKENPDLDDLNRFELLGLRTETPEKKRATFRRADAGFSNPLEFLNVKKTKPMGLQPPLEIQQLLSGKRERPMMIPKELGFIDAGELIIVELPPLPGRQAEKIIALRDHQGTVWLQDGTIVENPREHKQLQVSAGQLRKEKFFVSPETEVFLKKNIGKSTYSRVILRDRLPGGSLPFQSLDSSQLQIAEQNGDYIDFKGADGSFEKRINAEELRKKSAEQGQDVIRNFDQNPLLQDITGRAGKLQGNMQNMQLMLQTAMSDKASTSEAYIGQLRSYARPMLKILESSETKEKILETKDHLQAQLRQLDFGSYLGRGIESKIQERIKSLDKYLSVLDDNALLNSLRTAMELRPDDWESWLSKDGLIMLGSIVVAVAAISALTIFTGGAGLVAISAVGAAAGMAGAEGTKELLYQYHNTLGGADEGEYRYTEGARVGNYFRGNKLYNAETNEFVEMAFLKDVASPYAQEFLTSFATTALALGAGQIAGKALSTLAQNSKALQALSKNNKIVNRIMKRMSGISDKAAKLPPATKEVVSKSFRESLKEFGKKTAVETLDELKDELVIEAAITQVLTQIDERFAFLAGFIAAAGKGFRPMTRVNTSTSPRLSFDPKTMTDEKIKDFASNEGGSVTEVQNGIWEYSGPDGETLVLVSETSTKTKVVGAAPETTTTTKTTTVESTETELEETLPTLETEELAQKSKKLSRKILESRLGDGALEIGQINEVSLPGNKLRDSMRYLKKGDEFLMKNGTVYEIMDSDTDHITIEATSARGEKSTFRQTKGEFLQEGGDFENVTNIIKAGDESVLILNKKTTEKHGRELRRLSRTELMKRIDAENTTQSVETKKGVSQETMNELLDKEAVTLFKDYKAIRGLDKMGVSSEQMIEIAKVRLEIANLKIEEIIKLDDTVGKGRTFEAGEHSLDGLRKTPLTTDELGNIDSVSRQATVEAAEIEAVIDAISNPDAQHLARELWASLENTKQGKVMTTQEKAVIFRESMAYLIDFTAYMNSEGYVGNITSIDDVFSQIENNQRQIAHQSIFDRQNLTGSDHGVTHLLEGNMRAAESMMAGLTITPLERILVRQALIDHDMGYTITPTQTLSGDAFFGVTKDHPLYSTIYIESQAERYSALFGQEGYQIIRDSVLDHSDVSEFTLKDTDGNWISGKTLVENIVGGVDCLGTTADIKMMALFRDPTIMVLLRRNSEMIKRAKAAGAEITTEMVEPFRRAMISRINAMNISQELKDVYVQAAERNTNPKSPGFATSRDFGSHAAGFEGLTVDADGMLHPTFNVNQNFDHVREMFGADGDKVATSAMAKAMKDFGFKLGGEVTSQLDGSKRTYGAQEFASDLQAVREGRTTDANGNPLHNVRLNPDTEKISLIIEAPRGRFEFVSQQEKFGLSEHLSVEALTQKTLMDIDNLLGEIEAAGEITTEQKVQLVNNIDKVSSLNLPTNTMVNGQTLDTKEEIEKIEVLLMTNAELTTETLKSEMEKLRWIYYLSH